MAEEGLSPVIEEYLQAIYLIRGERGRVRAIDISKRLKTTPSTVHATLGRMGRDHLVIINDKKKVELTEFGEMEAKKLIYRHNLTECFLSSTLKIPWYEVHKYAHTLEHAMAPLVVEKLAEFLNYPEFCPHGVPIYGYREELSQWIALQSVEIGQSFRVMMVDEILEDSEELLKHLHNKGVVPNSVHTMSERLDSTHSVTLEVHATKQQVTLPFDVVQYIYVKLEETSQ